MEYGERELMLLMPIVHKEPALRQAACLGTQCLRKLSATVTFQLIRIPSPLVQQTMTTNTSKLRTYDISQ